MEFKLIYWNIRGRAEPIRMIFAAANVNYIDDRIERTTWPKLKPSMPWNQIPVLQFGDTVLAQSVTICRYLAQEFKLTGADPWETAKCDEYVDATGDLLPELKKIAHEKNEDAKSKLNTEFVSSSLPRYLEKMENILQNKIGTFLVGNSLTWADIFVSNTLDRLQKVNAGPTLLDEYPRLMKLKQAVFEYPGIKEWIENRPDE